MLGNYNRELGPIIACCLGSLKESLQHELVNVTNKMPSLMKAFLKPLPKGN